MTTSIGAYFQCYKNPAATFHALQSFRKSYPDSTVVLLSDNGYNYSKMATYFNAIYIHETENIPVSVGHDCAAPISSFNRFIMRLQAVLPLIREPYFMMLEDDVIVKQPYTEDFKGVINGNCINYIRAKTFEKIPVYAGPITNRVYSGHGGSVFNRKDLLDIISNESITTWLISNWLSLDLGHRLDCDIFLSLLVYISGYTIHPLNQHKDGMHNAARAHVLHQYKALYNVEPNELVRSLYSL
jgi:hypothetical protein